MDQWKNNFLFVESDVPYWNKVLNEWMKGKTKQFTWNLKCRYCVFTWWGRTKLSYIQQRAVNTQYWVESNNYTMTAPSATTLFMPTRQSLGDWRKILYHTHHLFFAPLHWWPVSFALKIALLAWNHSPSWWNTAYWHWCSHYKLYIYAIL